MNSYTLECVTHFDLFYCVPSLRSKRLLSAEWWTVRMTAMVILAALCKMDTLSSW